MERARFAIFATMILLTVYAGQSDSGPILNSPEEQQKINYHKLTNEHYEILPGADLPRDFGTKILGSALLNQTLIQVGHFQTATVDPENVTRTNLDGFVSFTSLENQTTRMLTVSSHLNDAVVGLELTSRGEIVVIANFCNLFPGTTFSEETSIHQVVAAEMMPDVCNVRFLESNYSVRGTGGLLLKFNSSGHMLSHRIFNSTVGGNSTTDGRDIQRETLLNLASSENRIAVYGVGNSLENQLCDGFTNKSSRYVVEFDNDLTPVNGFFQNAESEPAHFGFYGISHAGHFTQTILKCTTNPSNTVEIEIYGRQYILESLNWTNSSKPHSMNTMLSFDSNENNFFVQDSECREEDGIAFGWSNESMWCVASNWDDFLIHQSENDTHITLVIEICSGATQCNLFLDDMTIEIRAEEGWTTPFTETDTLIISLLKGGSQVDAYHLTGPYRQSFSDLSRHAEKNLLSGIVDQTWQAHTLRMF